VEVMGSFELSDGRLVERTLTGLHASLVLELPAVGAQDPILDIGCGTGAWLHRLGGLGYQHLHGIDLHPSDFSTKRATVSQANLDYDDIGLDDRKFTLITAIELIEHLENPGRLFYHVSRHMSDDGMFLVTTPNIHSTICRMRFFLTGNLKQFDSKGDQTHIYPVLITAIERILPRYGLRIFRQWSYPAKGSITSRFSTRILATAAEFFVPESIPGDTLCLLIRRE
jgi:2-polyprenyl-3-methyl-5-hydroxy-6-metoxy-1,4-benzoquinol methylase